MFRQVARSQTFIKQAAQQQQKQFMAATISRRSYATKEDTDVVELNKDQQEFPKELISGAPRDLSLQRQVRIYKEAKPATQSGQHNGKFWKIDWDVLNKGNRWENDLIGYQSSADYMQATALKFDTKEAAIRFATGQGYAYYVQEPKQRHFRKKEYSANFTWSEGPLKHIRTK